MADPRAPRLLTDLNNVFRKDPHIDEYDVLPVLEPKHNKSPFISQNHKLGVEAWAVKLLLKYSSNRLIGWRSRISSERSIDPIELSHLSRAVLLFNPDNYTAWNVRKELIETGYLSLSDDLTFGALVLSKHPKSPETFIQRRWLFQQLLDHCLSSSSGSNVSCSAAGASNDSACVNMETIDVEVNASPEPNIYLNGAFSLESSRLLKSHTQRELELSQSAAEHYPCNYHAWSHRIWIVQHCLNCSLTALLSELKISEQWTSTHVSDHSGFHYRQFLLAELHRQNDRLMSSCMQTSTELFIQEMTFICNLINAYPGHEATWYHRRFVFQSLLSSGDLELLSKYHELSFNGYNATTERSQTKSLDAMKSLLAHREVDAVMEKDALSSTKYHQQLAKKYCDWLQRLL